MVVGATSSLGHRYRIVRQLGSGGFGRTYLAEDLNRFNEFCVLKEFAPQVQDGASLQKAESLFEREAGVLYKLRHSQIPRFRELLRTQFEDQPRLFLVQDYVEGQTYQQLRDSRRFMGTFFTEIEVVRLFQSLLPVLQYLHDQGVIHRDISPDNLILRSPDQLPVLIDFGGVKQIAASVASQFAASPSSSTQIPAVVTRLGKAGYAPAEQIDHGQVFPHSDLYALAVTALVLLTGKEPVELGDLSQGQWKQAIKVSPGFSSILGRMLAPQPQQRYPSAKAVLEAVAALGVAPAQSVVAASAPSPGTAFERTWAIAPKAPPVGGLTQATQAVLQSQTAAPRAVPKPTRQRPDGSAIASWVATAILVGGVMSASWYTRNWWIPLFTGTPSDTRDITGDATGDSNLSPEEQARKASITQRRQDLGVDSRFLIQLTDEQFYRQYPEMQGQSLSQDGADDPWRERWDAIALQSLDWFEQNLSTAARRKLGNYGEGDRSTWRQQVNRLRVSSRALNDLADARFFAAFPDWRDTDFIDRPIGQVWQAIAFDQLQALQSGDRLQKITFDTGEFSGSLAGELAPGEGQVYIANLSQGQPIRLNVAAPAEATLLSLYLPNSAGDRPFLLEDSRDTRWSGELPQTGYYEIVVVSTADRSFRYTLDLAADQVTTTPIEPEDPQPDKDDDQLVAPNQDE